MRAFCREGHRNPSVTIHTIRGSVDVIIVFPHWGIEYEPPVTYQFELARDGFDPPATTK